MICGLGRRKGARAIHCETWTLIRTGPFPDQRVGKTACAAWFIEISRRGPNAHDLLDDARRQRPPFCQAHVDEG